MDYYRKLKTILTKEEFEKKISQYIAVFRKRENSYWGLAFNHSIGKIFMEEQRWSDLMKEIEKAPTLNLLDQFSNQLSTLFKDKYRDLYIQKVKEKMEQSAGRSIYKECCQYLKKIIHLNGVEEAKTIAENWKIKYPRRPAMLDELKKHGF